VGVESRAVVGLEGLGPYGPNADVPPAEGVLAEEPPPAGAPKAAPAGVVPAEDAVDDVEPKAEVRSNGLVVLAPASKEDPPAEDSPVAGRYEVEPNDADSEERGPNGDGVDVLAPGVPDDGVPDEGEVVSRDREP